MEGGFINKATQYSFLTFFIIYASVTILPAIGIILYNIFAVSNSESNKCKRLSIIISSIFQGHMLFLVFGPKYKGSYNLKDAIKVNTVTRCVL